MPRTSKKQFDSALKKEIWRLFWREIERAKAGADTMNPLEKFLTEDEKVILEKRLAILYFLKQGKSLRETSREADVTRKTIIFVKRGLKKNHTQHRSYSKFHKPPKNPRRRTPVYKGKGRWNFLQNY